MASPLDREEKSSYDLLVQAYDNYKYGFTTGDSRHSFIQLTVFVEDVNDEAPEFVEMNSQCTSISEFHQKHEPILTIRASDKDDPKSPNAEIYFAIKSEDEKDIFRLKNAQRGTARVYPNRSLKGFYGNYSLEIEAKDKGLPPNSVTAIFPICIQVDKAVTTAKIVSELYFRISMTMLLSLFSRRKTSRYKSWKMFQLTQK